MEDVIPIVRRLRSSSNRDDQLEHLDCLLRRICPRLQLYLRSRCYNLSDCDDILQKTLITISSSILSFKGQTNGEFWTWCFRIAHRRAVDHFRASSALQLVHLSVDEMRELAGYAPSANPPELYDIGIARALHALERLGDKCRRYLTLYFIHGLSYSDIATSVSKSDDAVRMTIKRCLEKARARF